MPIRRRNDRSNALSCGAALPFERGMLHIKLEANNNVKLFLQTKYRLGGVRVSTLPRPYVCLGSVNGYLPSLLHCVSNKILRLLSRHREIAP